MAPRRFGRDAHARAHRRKAARGGRARAAKRAARTRRRHSMHERVHGAPWRRPVGGPTAGHGHSAPPPPAANRPVRAGRKRVALTTNPHTTAASRLGAPRAPRPAATAATSAASRHHRGPPPRAPAGRAMACGLKPTDPSVGATAAHPARRGPPPWEPLAAASSPARPKRTTCKSNCCSKPRITSNVAPDCSNDPPPPRARQGRAAGSGHARISLKAHRPGATAP